jgi:flavin-dependent dehydrogenase
VPVTKDEFWWFTKTGGRKLPTPPQMHNEGNFIVSLGAMCAWLQPQAEALGVEIYPGFAAAEPLFDADGAVAGVRIGDMGVAKDGSHKPGYTQGIDIKAPITLLGEGARGHLTKQLVKKYGLDRDSDPQSYSIGIKELWQVQPGKAEAGKVVHTLGWPVDSRTYGGSFLYHLDQNRIALGYVIGLDYRDPNFAPYEAFQQWKNHPSVKALLEGGQIMSAGARAIATGGYQSVPKVEMPGAMLIGDSAGLLNVPKIKGTHQAIRSGVMAAEHIVAAGKPAGLRREAARLGHHEGAAPGAERQARVQARAPVRAGERGLGDHHGRALALDVQGQARLRDAGEGRGLRGAQARLRRAHAAPARPPGRRVLRLHRARRGPARAPARARHQRLRDPLRAGVQQPLHALLPRRGLRDRGGRERQAPADQRRQLRALQDLRHQGSVRDHQLGDARGRLGPQLPEPVTGLRNCTSR